MKRFLALLLSMILLFSCCAFAEEEAHTPAIHWRKDLTQKYAADDSVHQVIAVQVTSVRDARVLMFEKETVNGKTVWNETLTCDGIIGLNGLTREKKEGDIMTPAGDFGVTTAFGIKPNPGTALNYIDVDENTYCCGDELFYNQIINITEHSHDCDNGEHMIEYSPEYNYGMFLDYNSECEFGKGSAIFFHCMGPVPYTGGCIAVPEEAMKTILLAADAGIRVVIDYMP